MILCLCSEERFREGEVMVEVMSQSNSQEKLKLPKNIRQIGLPEEKKKIYVEDYVVTYMNQLASEYLNQQSAAVLLGFHTKQDDMRLTFINGAIGIPAAKVEEDQVSFSSDLWEDIYGTMRKYFHDCEIVGWFLTRPGKSLGINEKITKIHVDQFPGREKTLFLMDPLDREDAFFIYENGKLVRQHGYYIYYERNEDMQNYMVENRKGRGSEELLEAANLKRTTDIRSRSEKVKPKGNKPKGKAVAGTMVAAAAVVLLGVTLINRLYMPNRAKTVNGQVTDETVNVQVVEGALAANGGVEASGENAQIPENSQQEAMSGNLDTEEMNASESASDMGESATESGENASESARTTNVTTSKRYTVRKGDTLANISLSLYNSRDYVDTICEINDIEDPDIIYEGMVLELP